MLTTLLFPWLSSLRLDTISLTDDTILLSLTTTQAEALCPVCGQSSSAIHSRYRRTLADLPWASIAVRLHLHVRKFFCHNSSCPQMVFTERLPQVVAPFARRTRRLDAEQRQLALDLGAEAGARTAQRQGMPI